MSCEEIRALFSDVADARLAAGEQAAWDTHVATCPDCRREWASFQRTLGLLQGLPRHRAPTGFVDRVVAAAYPQPWPRRLARRFFVPVRVKVPLEAAALALLAFTGVYLVQRTPEMHEAMRDAAPTLPAQSPASSAPPPATSRSGALGGAKPQTAKPEGKGPTGQVAVAETAPDKAAESESTQTPQAPAPRTDEVTQPAAPGVQAPSPERPSRHFARQERISKTAAAAPMVAGRLTVENRDAAVPALTALVAKVGATEISRTVVDDGTLIELDVPRSRYAEFTQGLAAIGGWTPREERSGPGPEVRVRVIIGPSAR